MLMSGLLHILALLCMLSDQLVVDKPPSKEAVDKLQATYPGFSPQPGRQYVDMNVVPPISEQELLVWVDLLNLSEMQSGVARAYHAEYLERDQAVRKARMARIVAQAEAFGGRGAAAGSDVEVAEGYASVAAMCHELQQETAKVERALVNVIAEFLAEEQRANLDRVLYRRTRAHAAATPSLWPSAQADLSATVVSLMMADALHPRDPVAFEAVVREYERAAGGLAAKHMNAEFAVLEGATVLLARANNSAEANVRSQYLNQRMRLNKRASLLARRMTTLNRAYINLIVTMVPTQEGHSLLETFGAVAYPEVWPNPHFVTAMVNNVVAGKIDETTSRAIQSLSESHFDDQSRRCAEMMDEVDEWMEIVAERHTQPRDLLEEFESRMLELNDTRAEDAKRYLEAVMSLVPPDLGEELQQAVMVYRDNFSNRPPRRIGVSFRP